VGQGVLFEQVLELTSVEGVGHHLGEASAHLGLLTVADGLDQELAQRSALELELAQDIEHLAAEGLAGLLQLLQQGPVDIALPRLLGYEVPEMADLGLADAVDAAEALLQPVGVPGRS
jgi:hypothetical protein